MEVSGMQCDRSPSGGMGKNQIPGTLTEKDLEETPRVSVDSTLVVPPLAQIRTTGFVGTLIRIPNSTLLTHILSSSWSPLNDLFATMATQSQIPELVPFGLRPERLCLLTTKSGHQTHNETFLTFRLDSFLGKQRTTETSVQANIQFSKQILIRCTKTRCRYGPRLDHAPPVPAMAVPVCIAFL